MTLELLAVVEGVVMGRVTEQTKSGGMLSFQYEPSWLALNQAFPLSVSMPLSEAPYKHRVIRPFLSNLLPEDPAVLRRWEMEFHVSANNPFRLLQHVGEDCPGAAQFVRPERLAEYQDPGPPKVQWLKTNEIAERMSRLREDSAAFRLPNDRGRMSLPGAQAKTALYFDGKRWGVPWGRMPTSHILKPCIPGFEGIVENEHLCQDIAARCGLIAARSFVLELDEPVIVVERYDRLPHPDPAQRLRRVHQEDLCQALTLPPSAKYQENKGPGIAAIAQLLRGVSTSAQDDMYRFIEANVFNYLIGGTDAHAKNYSLLIGANQSVRLAPLYDLSSQLPYPDQIKPRLAMKVGRHYDIPRIQIADWRAMAKSCRLDEDHVVSTLKQLAFALPDHVAAARDQAIAQKLNKTHVKRASDMIIEHARQRSAAFKNQ